MNMILKAETMLFCMVSAINEACCRATVCVVAKFWVCVVGLYMGSPQHNPGRSPSAAAVAIAVPLANSLDQGL